ncbi:hypothetical protein Lalb_Chr02g0150861 [Lupinus albus]|uniref:Uncharacterized protein n=1 Tax=Lupinus albus TaxID=3870 RepID=A0A6A4R0H6_LUPAL|nr:hypothetical protein Lalb_Chr02g0150861 [Lupinus albus]
MCCCQNKALNCVFFCSSLTIHKHAFSFHTTPSLEDEKEWEKKDDEEEEREQ